MSMGEQKIGPFPHWTLSYETAGKRYSSYFDTGKRLVCRR